MTQPMEWAPTIHMVLGAEESIDTSRITGPPWLTLDMSFWESRQSTENIFQRPWNHQMPNGTDWNKITLYRYRSEGLDYTQNFQLIRATVDFYEGGDSSPREHARKLLDASRAIIDGIDANEHLDPQMFRDVAGYFRNLHTYLSGDGPAPLRSMYDEIEDGGVIDGSAADAFAWAMRDMALGMGQLAENISGRFELLYNHYVNTGWPAVLDDAAGAIDGFRQRMREAWSRFVSWTNHDPARFIEALLLSMEKQVDDAFASNNWGKTGDRQESWTFNFSEVLTNTGNPSYDLIQLGEWGRLNTDVKTEWAERYAQLNEASLVATRQLIEGYNDLLDAFGRGVIALPHIPYPTRNPLGDGLPNDGGGSGSDLGIDGGSGGGWADVKIGGDPGSGSQFGDGVNTGGVNTGGLDTGGFNGAGVNARGVNARGVNTGGVNTGGVNTGGLDTGGFNGAGVNIGGVKTGGLDTGGVNTEGLNNSGLNTAGFDRDPTDPRGAEDGPRGGVIGGGTVPGLRGTDGPGVERPGGGVSSGGSFPGLDDREAGTGSAVVGGTPSPLNPGESGLETGGRGSVPGWSGGDLGGTGTAPAGGFTADRPAGFALGPLGTPPAGYLPSPLNNFEAAAAAAGALAAGGYNAGGPPGAFGAASGAPGGMPLMPMGGMGSPGGRENEKERERTTWLAEEQDVWGTEPDVAASVIGREDFEPESGDRPVRRTSGPRSAQPTYEPARGRGTR